MTVRPLPLAALAEADRRARDPEAFRRWLRELIRKAAQR